MNVNEIAREMMTLGLNHLWQGSLLFLAVALLLKRFPKTNAVTGYWVWTATLTAVAVLPLASLMPRPERTVPPPAVATQADFSTGTPVPVTPGLSRAPQSGPESIQAQPMAIDVAPTITHRSVAASSPFPWAMLALVVWALGVAWKWLGAIRGGWVLHRLKRDARPFTSDEALSTWFQSQVAAWRIRRSVDLRVSTGIACPMALGFRRPAVLVPQHLLDKLTPAELKQVVMHELAHIKRGDDWMNLFQQLTVGLYWYHPGVALASRQMDSYRESACDDWAVAQVGGTRQFAQCLVKVFESMKTRPQPMLAVGAAGNKSQLAGRVERLLSARTRLGLKTSLSTLVGFALLLSVGLGSLVLATPRPQLAWWLLGSQEPETEPKREAREEPEPSELHREKQRLELEQRRLREETLRRQRETRLLQEQNQRAELEALREEQRRLELEARKLMQLQETAETEQLKALEAQLAEQAEALKEQERRMEAETRAMERAEMEDLQQAEARLEAEQRSLERELAAVEAEESALAREAAEAQEAMEAWSSSTETEAAHASSGTHSYSYSGGRNQSRTTFVDDGLRVDISGKVTFNEDETQILAITPGGFFEIEDKSKFGNKHRRLKIYPDRGGSLAFDFWENGEKKDYLPTGREWFEKTLPEFLRETGINGRERIRRIVERKGIDAALDYAAPVKSSHAKSLYYQGIVESGKLRDNDFERIARDTRTIESDHAKGRVFRILLANAGRDEKRLVAVLENADTIGSDHEHRQVLTEAARQGQNEKALGLILKSAEKIESDHGLGTLLEELIDRYPANQLMAQGVVRLAESVGSDHQHGRVLMALLSKDDLDSESVAQVIQTAATSIESDHSLAQVLQRAAERGTIDGTALFDAVAVMGSDHQKGQTLIRALSPGSLTQPQLKALLQAVMTMGSDHSKFQVLSALLDRYSLDEELKPLFRQTQNTIDSGHYHDKLERRLN